MTALALSKGGPSAISEPAKAADGKNPLTQSRIFHFFLPLALSWIFMSLESPIVAGIISRRPGEQLALAGMGLLWPIAILIEAPVIDLLSTSTTLSKNHQHYLQIRKFTVLLMLWVTFAHAAVSLSPFYWVLIEQWIGAEHAVAVTLRTPMIIMIPWAAFVGWRRYLHGILIRFDNTRPVGLGTSVRVLVVFLVAVSLHFATDLAGLTLAAIALLSSVVAETTFIHFVSLPTIKRNLDPTIGKNGEHLSFKKLASFHFPLTAASTTMILSMPLISWALANSPDGTLMLAAYGIAMGVMFAFRSVTFALPEAVIALYKDEQSSQALKKFCRNVGLVCSGAILLFYFSGASDLFFERLMDAEPDIAKLASMALALTVLVPAINSVAAHKRGLLTSHHKTQARLVAIVVAVSALVLTLVTGVYYHWNGVLVAGVAMTIQHIAELIVLVAFAKRDIPNGVSAA